MEERRIDRLGRAVSVIGLGTWQLGADCTYDRHGEAFDVRETFSGVPYEIGVTAARELTQLLDDGHRLLPPPDAPLVAGQQC